MLIEFEGKSPTIAEDVFIAPTAVLVGDVRVGRGSSIWFGAVLRADFGPIVLGERCSVQDNAVLHTFEGAPTELGDCVTVGHNVRMHACEIEDETIIGMGCIVGKGTVVRKGGVIAAGAVTAPGTEVAAGTIWAGNPARRSRPLSEENARLFSIGVDVYKGYTTNFRAAQKAGIG